MNAITRLLTLAVGLTLVAACQPAAEETTEEPAEEATAEQAAEEAPAAEPEAVEQAEQAPAVDVEGSGASAEGSADPRVLRPQMQLRPVQLRVPPRPGAPQGLQAPANTTTPGLNVPELQPSGTQAP